MSARRALALFIVVAAAAACSGDDAATPVSTTTTTAVPPTAAPPPPTTAPPPATIEPTPATSAPATTEPTRATLPPPVADDGSVREVVSKREDLRNIDAAIDAWLADSSGREGVLRNARGVTVFLPNDDGFTEDDLAVALADFDAFTVFLSEHLKVGVLRSDELGESVVTAMGSAHAITGGTIGGRLIVEADIEATNGVIHIIEGPLVAVTPIE
jgi:hypothetical protein